MNRPDYLTLRRELIAGQADAPNHWVDDLKLFAAAWLGGLVFFGTFIA